jgi:type IV pilus assembly protein PilX
MKPSLPNSRSAQSGVVLISSLLLLLVVTLMALSIFRSITMQERIGGNMREKQRALQVAVSTQQYAEWWLGNASNAPRAVAAGIASSADVACGTTVLDANLGAGQICLNSLISDAGITSVANWPGAATNVGVAYTPPGLNYTTADTNPAIADIYYGRPRFYIMDIGALATGRGEAYQIDAYSYGLGNTTIAVVESTVAVTCQVCNVGAL